jgi:hypothetical protein
MEVVTLAGRTKGPKLPKPRWPRSDDGTVAVLRFDPSRISHHEARKRMRAFLTEVEQTEGRTRTFEVTIPDVDLANNVDWPEAALLAHFAFGTPNPIAAEYEFEPEPDEE